MVRLQHFLDAAVEPLDHAIGLRVLRRGQAMLDAEVAAQMVERVLAARLRRPNRRSVHSFPLAIGLEPMALSMARSVSTVRMCSGQARSRSRKNRRALAAVLAL